LPEEIVILALHRAEYRRCAHLRRRRTIALNTLRQLADAACAYGAGGRDWPGWLAEAEAIAARCPTRKTVNRSALEAVVAELERRRRDGEAALRAAFAAGDEDEVPRPRRQRIAPLKQRQPMGPQIDPLSMTAPLRE
jgi:hypothetical protein